MNRPQVEVRIQRQAEAAGEAPPASCPNMVTSVSQDINGNSEDSEESTKESDYRRLQAIT